MKPWNSWFFLRFRFFIDWILTKYSLHFTLLLRKATKYLFVATWGSQVCGCVSSGLFCKLNCDSSMYKRESPESGNALHALKMRLPFWLLPWAHGRTLIKQTAMRTQVCVESLMFHLHSPRPKTEAKASAFFAKGCRRPLVLISLNVKPSLEGLCSSRLKSCGELRRWEILSRLCVASLLPWEELFKEMCQERAKKPSVFLKVHLW